ncbi:MAG: carbamoylphosphate synthase large subunit, partial [[Clostridium] innocuum]
MNFIFISPHFPESYWLFCQGLKNNGVNVLAIADTPYNSLSTNLKNSINDFYQVSSLENYDEMLRAVAWFTYKHGKIDWIESNNEYWLRQDAALRRDFHVENGFPCEALDNCQSKHRMKEFFAAAGLKTARWQLATTLKDAQAFTELVGYPIVIKPDIGVGAS